MTPDDWWNEIDPYQLVQQAGDTGALRHFSLACCRRYWDSLWPVTRAWITQRENGFDGLPEQYNPVRPSLNDVNRLAWVSAHCSDWVSALDWAESELRWDLMPLAAKDWMCDVIRDVVDGPCSTLRPVALWGEGSNNRLALLSPSGPVNLLVRSLAEGRGELDPLTVLALGDALEEAICTNYGVLSHLRSGLVHVKGCRAVEMLKNVIQEGV